MRLLGFADKGRLMMVQELLAAPIDKQLCKIVMLPRFDRVQTLSNKHLADVEEWRPTAEQQLKVALDVAKGMEYLHTCFQHDGSQQDQVSTTLPPELFRSGQ